MLKQNSVNLIYLEKLYQDGYAFFMRYHERKLQYLSYSINIEFKHTSNSLCFFLLIFTVYTH